ncbi:C40 family peptidase [Streptomyces sp. NEAU-PBA10]|uniref:C40 family peptidase n=1 Tax=Streptomyces TaxID=1883 RepID=UPI001D03A559|nr:MULTISPECIES: bifunctional lytic transglycosylase/C40 family peptidase [Streptomyces]UDF06244.1 bifunctional lytic transglycosylase/C40 family peptidase [Streptomyces sp. WA1-19]UYX94771.1 bifunctional lytic transglycosylase/C40 family peptidase [Streptomyces sp. BI87]
MKKVLVVGGIGVTASLGFVGLLFVGTLAAAGSLAGGAAGGAVGLAKGAVPAQYQSLVQKWGNLCPAINPALLAAQLYQESGFNPKAQSPAAAQGIAQFIPGTWATHGIDGNKDGVRDVWDPQDAIPSAAYYDCELAKYVKDAPGDPTHNMLAAYNAGPYAVIKYGGVPPYSETQNYVKTITDLSKSFARPVTRVEPSKQAAQAIQYAQQKLGTPYLWGGTGTAEQGGRFDCSGLTQAAYRTAGIELPRVANDQYNAGPHPSRDELLPGDLVFFSDDLTNSRAIRHVGIYVGGGYMIDAPRPGAVVRFSKMDTPDYFGATRVTAAGAEALPTAPAEEQKAEEQAEEQAGEQAEEQEESPEGAADTEPGDEARREESETPEGRSDEAGGPSVSRAPTS